MSELSIPKERIGKLNDLLLRCIDPTFYRVNRMNHGFAEGVIEALDVLYDEKHPKLIVEAYTEELTADANLGVEALQLIEALLKVQLGDVADALVSKDEPLVRKMIQLIEAWKANTWTKANMPDIKIEHINPACLRLPSGRVEKFTSQAELMTIREVEGATNDYGHLFFRRLGIMEANGIAWLYAEFVSSTGAEQSHTRIGTLSGDFQRLNLATLCTDQ